MKPPFETLELPDWTVRIRDAAGTRVPETALLLHGLTGNEHVMEIFGARLPSHYLLVAPRALNPAANGGYSWLKEDQGPDPPAAAFERPIRALLDLLDIARYDLSGDFNQVHIMGFSQGAALAYLFALQHPGRIRTIAGLAGFLPDGATEWIEASPLEGVPAFISHGTQDSTVSIERGRASVRALQQAGAVVTYCEAEVGHKLGGDCFRALGHFYQTHDADPGP